MLGIFGFRMDKTSQAEDTAGRFDWQRLLFLAMLAAWAFAIYWVVTELAAVLTLKQFLAIGTVIFALAIGVILRR
ncbi:hypothetical protein G5V57_33070 [Nordella sp. HKS 07]|uniref:hypothetical protein n=1 Tax=Nordella sp. HKS 07 TaxID=2712222 RepID=UPI0013E10C95|nr:hypothetical protein [Nordella sp. HKS 07]QIG52110.1 hypothetical protein G5V57_33070 [Nordella sp. HKS 07]